MPATSGQNAGSSTQISACRAAPGWPNTQRSPSSTRVSWPWRSWLSWRSSPRFSKPAPRPLASRPLRVEVRSGLFMEGLLSGSTLITEGGLMIENGGALDQQAQRLPINAQHGLAGHPGEGQQVAMQAGAVERLAAQAEAGLEELFFALPVGHVNAQALAGRGEAHAVFQVAGQERRDVEALWHAMAQLAGAGAGAGAGADRQYVVVTLAPRRVAHLAENCCQTPVVFMAEKNAQRVERQAPAARLGQQADATLRPVAD